MRVSRLEVNNFRNASSRSVELCAERNAFVGANARGKTNLLEAVYLSGVGRSFRTPRERELIKTDAARASVFVRAEKEYGADEIRIILDREQNKRVAVNNVPISRLGELMGVCPVVLFCPDGLKIVKEAPADRRKFLDVALCQASKAYFAALSSYGKALANRNKALKSGGVNENALAVWDELLADYGAKIVKSRRGYVRALSVPARLRHEYLTRGAEKLELEYEGAAGESVEEIKCSLLKELCATRSADMRLMYTHAGPHKDDVKISVNDSDIRSFGSQGQQRTAALSLKLAEVEMLGEVIGTSPVLLLDDVFSELDIDRRGRLLAALDGFQSIITATDCGEFDRYGVNIVRI